MIASRSHDERKRADSLLSVLERQFAIRAVRFVPSWLESHHLMGQLNLSFLKLGPVEIRLIFIGINTTFLTFGRSSMVAAVPPVLLISGGVLVALVCRTQRRLWQMDAAGRRSTSRTATTACGREPSRVLR